MNIKRWLLSIIKFARTSRWLEKSGEIDNLESPFRHDFAELTEKTVLREDYLLKMSVGKRVLHFGFIDTPFMGMKLAEGSLLHTKIRAVSSYVFGVDVDEDGLTQYREITGDNENVIADITSSGCDLNVFSNKYDVILFPEVLEHIPDSKSTMIALLNISRNNGNIPVYISVPNAFSIHGIYGGIHGVELVHHDHFYYFSPWTLSHLVTSFGFKVVDIMLYEHLKHVQGLTKAGIIIECVPDE